MTICADSTRGRNALKNLVVLPVFKPMITKTACVVIKHDSALTVINDKVIHSILLETMDSEIHRCSDSGLRLRLRSSMIIEACAGTQVSNALLRPDAVAPTQVLEAQTQTLRAQHGYMIA